MSGDRYALFDTAIGTCAIAWSGWGIRRVCLPEQSEAKLQHRLAQLGAEPATASREARHAIRLVQRHLTGKPTRFSEVVLDLHGAPAFHRRVFEALAALPPGTTVSYGELAEKAGSPGAARAVGRAMATNPLPILVPCHRVLAAGGKPGGFSAYGGNVTKARLLALEGVDLDAPLDGQLPFDWTKAQRGLRRMEPAFGPVIARTGTRRLELKNHASTFAALAEAIVYQQLTAKAAASIFGRVRDRFHPFSATPIARASEKALRSCGLSRSKAASLRDLAERTCARQLPSLARLARMDDESIVESLTQVRGIGRWTVEMLLIFQLGRPDVLPSGDFGVRKGFARLFDLSEPPPPRDISQHGERWRPYRTAASWYLWRATETIAR